MQNKMQNENNLFFCANDFFVFQKGSTPLISTKIKSLATQGFFHFLYVHQRFLAPPFSSICMPTHTFVCPIIHLMQNENAKRNQKSSPPAISGRLLFFYTTQNRSTNSSEQSQISVTTPYSEHVRCPSTRMMSFLPGYRSASFPTVSRKSQ